MSSGSPPLFDDLGQRDAGSEDDAFHVESSNLSVERRLTSQGKLRRGGLAFLVVAVAGFFLLGGPYNSMALLSSLQTTLRQATSPLPPVPQTLEHVTHSDLPMPPGVQYNLTVRFAPANGPHGYIYSCWTSMKVVNDTPQRVFHAAVWTSTTQTWVPLTVPVSSGSTCKIAPDREQETGVLLAVWPEKNLTSNACVLPQLFHSDDAGTLWTPIPWPNEIQPTCDPQFFLEGGRVYVGSDTALLPPHLLTPTLAAGYLISTDTHAILWRTADSGQAGDTSFRLVGLRSGGSLLAESLVKDVGSNQLGLLWESTDFGATWKFRSLLPGSDPVVSVSSDPSATDHGGWGYIYVSYFAGMSHTRPALGYGALDGPQPQWTSLPLPTSTGSPAGGPMAGLLPDGSEGPLESLIYLRSQEISTHELTPLYLPWIWDTARQTWALDPEYIPANTIAQGVSWKNGTMNIIISIIHQGVEPSLKTVILTLTPLNLAPAHQ
jgi:hypothetical protein